MISHVRIVRVTIAIDQAVSVMAMNVKTSDERKGFNLINIADLFPPSRKSRTFSEFTVSGHACARKAGAIPSKT